MRLTVLFPRTCAVVATLSAVAAGLALPAAAEAGVARTAACTFVPSDSDSRMDGPAVVAQYVTPSAVPAGATAFTSPDGFGGREYMLGPSDGTCVAHAGFDEDFDQQIMLAGQHTPAFEQVFGAGGDGQIRFSCRYLSAIRTFADPVFRADCGAVASTEHIEMLNTGMASLYAALVRVEPKVADPQLATSGTGPVLAVVLAFDYGADPDPDPPIRHISSPYADCRLSATTTDICRASLQVFTQEAITFQSHYNGFRPTGDPGAKIRNAIAGYGHEYATRE